MIMTREISKYDDIIDSRDVIARIEELSDPDYGPLNDGEFDELEALKSLRSEAVDLGIADWEHGATLVRDSYFIEYAQELAEELDLINPNAAWPATYIDWDRAADALKMDYSLVAFDGVEYWVR